MVVVLSFLLSALPYFIYGAGHDALSFTEEFGTGLDLNATQEVLYQHKMKNLCYEDSKTFLKVKEFKSSLFI